MTRQAVAQHLKRLEDANLVAAIRRGREKLQYINPVPIHEICDRWIQKYERQHVNVSDWKPGSRWEHRRDDENGEVLLVGKVVESTPSRRLVITWAFPADESHAEKHTRVTFDIEPIGDLVRLTVTHDRLEPGSEMLEGITKGWPKVLSSLKSYLEVGRPLPGLW